MSRWPLTPLELPLRRVGDARPLFVQIAEGLAAGMRAGRLPPGARLPGSRSLAAQLEVHRNTVLSAYAELQAEGWLDTRPGGGTFVSAALPVARAARFSAPVTGRDADRLGFELGPPLPQLRPHPPPGYLSFGSTADTRSLPWKALARAFRRSLARSASSLLDYADPMGHLALRGALATMLSQIRGLGVTADDVFVSRGSQMALYLLAQAVVRPGDVVAVEALGYRPAWSAFEAAGARLVGVPVDGQGVDVDAIDRLSAGGRLRAVYVTPHHQYPTTVSLSPARRIRLLELAARRGFAIIEDDYDNEFHYETRPIQPLAAADRAGVVLYVGTLSKVLAPGLRLGFVVAPAAVLERVRAVRLRVDRQGDPLLERALAALFEEGEIQRHVRRMRGVYRQRRDALAEQLQRHLGDALRFELPRGGMAIWVEVASDIDVERWVDAAAKQQVHLLPGSQFTFDRSPMQRLRLGFANMTVQELGEAIRRLRVALG